MVRSLVDFFMDFDPFNAAQRASLPTPRDHPFHTFRISLEDGLDSTVRKIPYPPCQPFEGSRVPSIGAEENPLNSSFDQHSNTFLFHYLLRPTILPFFISVGIDEIKPLLFSQDGYTQFLRLLFFCTGPGAGNNIIRLLGY